MVIIFILYQVPAVDDDQQVIVGHFTFVKNIDLVKLWLEAVTRYLSENRCLKAIKNDLKFNQIPWKINKKEIIINNTPSLQPTTLLKMKSLMNLFWQFRYFSSISYFQVFNPFLTPCQPPYWDVCVHKHTCQHTHHQFDGCKDTSYHFCLLHLLSGTLECRKWRKDEKHWIKWLKWILWSV